MRAAVFALASAVAAAQGAAPQSFIIQRYPPANPSIKTASVFPTPLAGNLLPSSQLGSVVCGFVNEGDKPVNISGIFGSLNSPLDFSRYLHNFTAFPVGDVVGPGDEIALEYKFYVPPVTEPTEAQMAFTVFYDDGMYHYASTFYNQTITLTERADGAWDPRNIASTLLALACVLGALYFMKDLLMPRQRGARPGATKAEETDDSEFAGSIRAPSANSRSSRRGQSSSKSS